MLIEVYLDQLMFIVTLSSSLRSEHAMLTHCKNFSFLEGFFCKCFRHSKTTPESEEIIGLHLTSLSFTTEHYIQSNPHQIVIGISLRQEVQLEAF